MISRFKLVVNFSQPKKFYSLLGLQKTIEGNELKTKFKLIPITNEKQLQVLEVMKNQFMSTHLLVRARNYTSYSNNCALDEFLLNMLRRGNSLCAHTPDGELAGVCINFAACKFDPKYLVKFATYRQDPKLKEFLYFTAKMQENPNLWDIFQELKIFEIKMLLVEPKFRRQGLGSALAQKSIDLARDQGYTIVRMDCLNPYDNKIAERCNMHCLQKCSISELKNDNGHSFIEKEGIFDCLWRVYVDNVRPDKMNKKWLKDVDLAKFAEKMPNVSSDSINE